MRGTDTANGFVTAFSCRKSTQNLWPQSFFSTITIGETPDGYESFNHPHIGNDAISLSKEFSGKKTDQSWRKDLQHTPTQMLKK